MNPQMNDLKEKIKHYLARRSKLSNDTGTASIMRFYYNDFVMNVYMFEHYNSEISLVYKHPTNDVLLIIDFEPTLQNFIEAYESLFHRFNIETKGKLTEQAAELSLALYRE
jgi:hypothetical protein